MSVFAPDGERKKRNILRKSHPLSSVVSLDDGAKARRVEIREEKGITPAWRVRKEREMGKNIYSQSSFVLC